MKLNKILTTIIIMVFSILVMPAAMAAAEQDEENFYGDFLFGYRFVDVDGVETKYREDINLESGPRLMNLNLHYTAEGSIKKVFDRLSLYVYNFGGDPYETMALTIDKSERFKFDYRRRKSAYFYRDNLSGGDMHHFDFERIMDSGSFRINLTRAARVYMNFNLYNKTGGSTTSFDINRDEFEFDKPIDESSREVSLGLDISLKKISFVLEERVQDYENTNSLFLPGFSLGEDPDPAASLNYFYLNQPYDFKSYSHMAKIKARPLRSLLVQGSVQLSKQDTNLSYAEESGGTDYLGSGFSTMFQGEGSFQRDIHLYDLDMTLLLGNKLALIGAVRYYNFEQEGELTGDMAESSQWDYNTLGFEGGAQYQASSKFALTAGYRSEAREMERGVEEIETETTKRRGMFGNLLWKLTKDFKITADYQYGTYQDVFTLTSPTEFHRLRLTGRFKAKQFYASGSYIFNKSESDILNDLWQSNRNQLDLRAGYQNRKIRVSLGYGLIDVKQEGDRTIAYPPSWSGSGTFLWEILYEGKSNLLDAYLHYKLSKKLYIGGFINCYRNKGSWELSRMTLKTFVKYHFENGFIGRLGYRLVDFKEKEFGYNDYKAGIGEISLGYRW